jgi:hypothetical protein
MSDLQQGQHEVDRANEIKVDNEPPCLDLEDTSFINKIVPELGTYLSLESLRAEMDTDVLQNG